LTKLETLRIDGNPALCDPPPDIIAHGAKAIVKYMTEAYAHNELYIMRTIVLNFQGILQQINERGLADPSMFEPHTKIQGSEDGEFCF
jgi:hypothetical protein